MEITGRLTADASVKTLKDKRQVVTFTIALNNRYKTKDGEKKDITSFINCSYWISATVAKQLLKGNIVTVQGYIGINAYKSMDGDFHAYLTFHANYLQILSREKSPFADAPVPLDTKEDLPF